MNIIQLESTLTGYNCPSFPRLNYNLYLWAGDARSIEGTFFSARIDPVLVYASV